MTSWDEVFFSKSLLCKVLWPCGSSDAAAKIVYMTLQDHVIKGSSDFMGGNTPLYFPNLPKLIATDIVLMNT